HRGTGAGDAWGGLDCSAAGPPSQMPFRIRFRVMPSSHAHSSKTPPGHRRHRHVKYLRKRSWFSRTAEATARGAGRPGAFAIAVGIIVVWGLAGPMFGFSDT